MSRIFSFSDTYNVAAVTYIVSSHDHLTQYCLQTETHTEYAKILTNRKIADGHIQELKTLKTMVYSTSITYLIIELRSAIGKRLES